MRILLICLCIAPIVLTGSVWSIIGLKNRRYRQALEQMAPELKRILVEPGQPVTALIPAKFEQELTTIPLLHYSVLSEAASTGRHIAGPRRFSTFLKGGENECILPSGLSHQLMFNIYGKDLYFGGVKVKEVVVASNGRGCVAITEDYLGIPGMGTEAMNSVSLLPEILIILQKHFAQHNLNWDAALPQPLTIFAPRRNDYWTNLSARLSPDTIEALLLAHVTVGSQSYSLDIYNGQKLNSLTQGLVFEVEQSKATGIRINGRKLLQFDAAVKYGVAHVVERPLIGGKELAQLLTVATSIGSTKTQVAYGYGNAPLPSYEINIHDVPDPSTLINIDEGLDLSEESMGPPLNPIGVPDTTNNADSPDNNTPAAKPPGTNCPSSTPTTTFVNSNQPPSQTNCPNNPSPPTYRPSYNIPPAIKPPPSPCPKPSQSSNTTSAESNKRKQEEIDTSDGILKGIVIAMLASMGVGGIFCAVYLIRKSRRPPFAHHRVHTSL